MNALSVRMGNVTENFSIREDVKKGNSRGERKKILIVLKSRQHFFLIPSAFVGKKKLPLTHNSKVITRWIARTCSTFSLPPRLQWE